MSQAHGSSLWRESAGSGAVPTASAVVFQLVGGKWTPVVSTAPQARLLDINGTGKYTLVDVRSEYVLSDIGAGKLRPTAGGTAVAVMGKTAGKFIEAAAGALAQAARFFPAGGKLRLVPADAAELLLVLVGSKIRAY